MVPERKLQIHAISLYSFNNEREQILAGCQVSVTYIFIVREKGTVVLRSNNIQSGKMNYDNLVRVSCDIPEKAMIHKGDILICARNGSRKLVGKSAIVDKEGMAFGAFMAKYHSEYNYSKYIQIYIESPQFRRGLDNVGTETINQITQKMLKTTILPLPPLAEQKRIVAKIEELMPMVEALENGI